MHNLTCPLEVVYRTKFQFKEICEFETICNKSFDKDVVMPWISLKAVHIPIYISKKAVTIKGNISSHSPSMMARLALN